MNSDEKTHRDDVQIARHQQPLSPIMLHLLMSLTNGPLHGYGMKKVVERRTQGHTLLGPSTLYGTLARMEKNGLVRRDNQLLAAQGPASSRMDYHLTGLGLKVLEAERMRLKQMIAFIEESLFPATYDKTQMSLSDL